MYNDILEKQKINFIFCFFRLVTLESLLKIMIESIREEEVWKF